MAEKFTVEMLDAEDGGRHIETVVRSFTLGHHEFGWLSYKGQRCKVISGPNGHNYNSFFSAWYYPSRGKWR